MTNPLLAPGLPQFHAIQAAHMLPALESRLEKARNGIVAALATTDISYDSIVAVREALEDDLQQTFSTISHLDSVVNTPEIRAAHATCRQLMSAYNTEMGQNQALFSAYSHIAKSQQFSTLDAARQKAVHNALRDFKLGGIDLPPAEQASFAQLSEKLAELETRFSNNVLDATQAFSRLIVDAAELSGLPDDVLVTLNKSASNKNLEGYLLTLDAPCYLAVMQHCENAEIRKDIYMAYGTRASDRGPQAGEFDNSEAMGEILKARHEKARLLGFENYAELSIQRKMAASTDQVLTFLTDLADRSRQMAVEECSEIEQFARENFGVKKLHPWDLAYYAEKLKKARFDISQEELRPYFPVPVVLRGMFEVVRRLYDIEISAISDLQTWHPDVTTWLIERDGEPVARFYCDLYAREGKQGGAWMADCRVRRISADVGLQLPVAYLTCNFTNPLGDRPALLSHDEVITLFHEFGHGLHHMMSQVTAAPVSGINGVAWDAVELPSQFMENWCWQAESLALISGHIDHGEPLPRKMLDKLLAARHFQSAMMMVRQIEFGLFDFRLHAEFDPAVENQVGQVLDEVRRQVAVMTPPPEYRFQHGFTHIFSGAYAAGYYSYKWAEVLSADAFARFLEDGLFNRQTGEEFLSTVLEQGGSQDAMTLFVAFRGREPSVDALLLQEGIGARA